MLKGDERRERIIEVLSAEKVPISGSKLAGMLEVSRQIVVQDIALLRANGKEIVSTNLGYLLIGRQEMNRVFKVIHTEQQVEDELFTIVDNGGTIKDIFVYHKVYGTVKADLNIRSRKDVMTFMDKLHSGKSSLLMNVTSGYHYHTVVAEDEETLNLIQDKLQEAGFLAPLQDWEPINFWKE